MVAHHFTGKGIDDSVIFHIKNALSFSVALQFYKTILLTISAMLATLLILYLLYTHAIKKNIEKKKSGFLNSVLNISYLSLAFFSLLAHPALQDAYVIYKEYRVIQGDDILGKYLSDTENAVSKLKPRSFVYLYLESLDQIFFDEEKFPKLLPNLKETLGKGKKINGIYQAPMTGWTMAGIVSTQCGLPLFRMATANTYSTEQQKRTTCVGDILSENNYYLSFMGGADVTFTGKGEFFLQHGFNEVIGSYDLDKIAGASLPRSKWGVYDDDLFRLALQRFETIASEHEQFGLVLLTVDTHPPSGHETPACKGLTYADGSSGVLNSIHCADRIVTKFINDILNSPHSEDITLIISSDHLMMGNDAGIEPDNGQRQNTFFYFNANEDPPPLDRQATMLDVAPTLLHLLGFDTPKLGLGNNLFSSEPTLMESIGKDEFYRLILVWRYYLMKSWSDLTPHINS